MRVTLRDVELEYDVLGDGPELVWLHGLTGSLEESRPLCERLARDYRVLWYSTRGHGRSTAVLERARYTYDLIADDLAGMLEHVGFDRPLLAGGSHGANTILRHELRHPGNARGLLLVAPGANALRRPSRPVWALVHGHTVLAARKGEHAVIKAITGHDPRDPAADPVAVAAARTHDMPSLLAAMHFVADQQVVPPSALASFDVPTVIGAWARDPLIHPIKVARRIAALVPGAEFHEIPRAAGLAPDLAVDIMRGLLGRLEERVAAA